jgi:hypothetical protein
MDEEWRRIVKEALSCSAEGKERRKNIMWEYKTRGFTKEKKEA